MDSCLNTTDILLPLFNPRKRVTANQLKKSLNQFGYKTWCSFLPADKENIEGYAREKLNKKFFQIMLEISEEKWKLAEQTRKFNKLRPFEQADYKKKHPNFEPGENSKLMNKLRHQERTIHESYQIILSEHYLRRKAKKQQQRRLRLLDRATEDNGDLENGEPLDEEAIKKKMEEINEMFDVSDTEDLTDTDGTSDDANTSIYSFDSNDSFNVFTSSISMLTIEQAEELDAKAAKGLKFDKTADKKSTEDNEEKRKKRKRAKSISGYRR